MTSLLPYGGAGLFVLLNLAWAYTGIFGPGMTVPPDPEFVKSISELVKLLWVGSAAAGGTYIASNK